MTQPEQGSTSGGVVGRGSVGTGSSTGGSAPAGLSAGGSVADVKLPEYPDFLPTVHVPVVSDDQRELLRVLHALPIMFAVNTLNMRLAASQDPVRKADDAVTWLTSMAAKLLANNGMMELLMHSISVAHIRAIVMGTIGWQISPERAGTSEALAPSPYHQNGPGTYIATISIQGCQGKGLSGNEYKHLADKVALYLMAYEASQLPEEQRTQTMTDALEWAYFVDSYYAQRQAKLGTSAFLESADSYNKVALLERNFRSFHACTIPLDPDAHLVQGMSYVGCAARDMTERSSFHLQSSQYEGSYYTWWLTMSCTRDMGLQPVVRIIHAIRTWEPKQLPISEVLVTVLARSLVEDCGFNAWPPGDVTDSITKSPRD
ncbi:hypothetical protein F5X98DRAFT_347314 [Xylaria grammica]|nr:hypothetical protein F5X98DRAFT_347314 [Xylaria grammica]